MPITEFKTEFWSLGSALVLLAIGYLFQARAQLLWGVRHDFRFLVPSQPGKPPDSNIHTTSLFVQNWSRRVSATELEVTFNWKPENVNIWPVRPFDIVVSPDNRYTLKFPNLAPREHFQVELLANRELPAVLGVRCKECVGIQVPIRFVRAYSRWVYVGLYVLLFLGLAELIQLIIKVANVT